MSVHAVITVSNDGVGWKFNSPEYGPCDGHIPSESDTEKVFDTVLALLDKFNVDTCEVIRDAE